MKPSAGQVWRHLKTGNEYRVLGRYFDATNATEGTIRVSYLPRHAKTNHLIEVECSGYTRELSEFMERFEHVQFDPTGVRVAIKSQDFKPWRPEDDSTPG